MARLLNQKIKILKQPINKKIMTHLKLKTKRVNTYTNNSLKRLCVTCCIAVVILTSCGGSDDGLGQSDCTNALWVKSIQTELNAWTTAAQTNVSDPSPENCQKYKSTGQDYINALDRIKDCVPNQSLADFEDSLEEARTEINNIPC